MAAAGTLGAAGCLWPPATTIPPGPSPSSSNPSGMSATGDAPGLSLSEQVLLQPRCLGLFPSPPLPASSRRLHCRYPYPRLLLSAPDPPSPVPAATSPSCPCPAALLAAGCPVAGLSGIGGDDSTTDDVECIGERGGRGGVACIQATSIHTPTNFGPQNPLTACGGGEAVAADEARDFGWGVWDIALQYMVLCTSLCCHSPAVTVPRRLPWLHCGPCALRAHLAFGPWPAVPTSAFAPNSCTHGTVPLPCPVVFPSAALISPPGHVLDDLVQSWGILPFSPACSKLCSWGRHLISSSFVLCPGRSGVVRLLFQDTPLR